MDELLYDLMEYHEILLMHASHLFKSGEYEKAEQVESEADKVWKQIAEYIN